MKSAPHLKAVPNTIADIPFQSASTDIWDKKYRLKTKDGTILDRNLDDTFKRVARALAEVESSPEKCAEWGDKFLWALRRGAIPAGRVISNAGAVAHKPATSTVNCTVSGTIHDSMDDILQKVYEAGLTLKAGSGTGYEFSTLRPRGAYVSGSGSFTSGPLSFMDIYDKMCFTVSSAGGRRGAQMATFDVGHPDVMEFIRVKREAGRLRQFNLSLLITAEFMDAVLTNSPWQLAFPLSAKEIAQDAPDLQDSSKTVWRSWPHTVGYLSNNSGHIACKIYRTIPARKLWDLIMASTYDYAEPGFILIDQYNEMNNNWWCENIRATNPCAEQGLPPYGSCLLGSLNLTNFVIHPFTDRASFDWEQFRKVVAIFTRMLDNVVEINGLPLDGQRKEIFRKRRHGMGYLGLGSTLTMLRLRYGSPESLEFTEEVTREMALTGWRTGLELAKEKGPAPIMEEHFIVTEAMLRQRPEMADDGYRVGDGILGKVLHARYSRYMQRVRDIDPNLVAELEQQGCRFTHHTSIAPTGCVVLDTLIVTDKGVQKIQELGDVNGEQWQIVDFNVATDTGFKQATQFFVNGKAETIKITTAYGRTIEATANHQIKVICPENGYVWKKLEAIQHGDVIPSLVNNYPNNIKPPSTLHIELNLNETHYHNRSGFSNPEYLTADIAAFVGFLHSNGNVKTERHIRLYHHVDYAEQAFKKIADIVKAQFNLDCVEKQLEGEKYAKLRELDIHSLHLVSWLEKNGLSKTSSTTITVPQSIRLGGRDIINAYLKGVFEGDGCISQNAIALSSVSEVFITELQILMQSIGIVARKDISIKANAEGHKGDKDVYRLSVNHFMDKQRFMANIGFISNKGNVAIESSRNENRRQLKGSILEKIGLAFGRSTMPAILNQIDVFQNTLSDEIFFEEVAAIETGYSDTYDLSVPENVTYTANNLISHNTISLSLANNASNGIEPSFAHHYSRNVIREGKKTKEKIDVYSFELLAYHSLINPQAMPYAEDPTLRLPDYFVTAEEITPRDHIDIQAAAQRWIDSSISKTINVPANFPFDDFKDVYLYAYRQGLKGCTTFRYNPEAFQGVLVNEKDLAATRYQFVLEDGTIVEAKGNEEIVYDGEIHNAANLYDALKEGYYGKL